MKNQSDFSLTYLAKTSILIENKQASTGGYHEAVYKMSIYTYRQKRVGIMHVWHSA